MYRWQDPPTPAVSAIRERRMVRLFVAQHGANVRAETTPIEPKDEAAELQRQAAELLAGLERITDRMARLQPALLKAVA